MKKTTKNILTEYICENKIKANGKWSIYSRYTKNKFSFLRKGFFVGFSLTFLLGISLLIKDETPLFIPVLSTAIALIIASFPELANFFLSKKIKSVHEITHEDIHSLSKILPREEMDILLNEIKNKKIGNIIDKSIYHTYLKKDKREAEIIETEENKELLLNHLYKRDR